jgi:inosine/xanthosine triphosphatase
MSESITLAVGSKNPIKLNAAVNGTKRVFPEHEILAEGYNVPSGVQDQPMGDVETKTGAANRAKAAYVEYTNDKGTAPKYAIGLEGGVLLSELNELECMAWMAIYDGSKVGYARTASFGLPPAIRDLVVNEGMELGHADDKVFGKTNSKQSAGAVGLLSHGVIDRAQYYEHAIVLAYFPFQWPDLYV